MKYALARKGRGRQDRYESTVGGIFGRAKRSIRYHLAGARGRLAEAAMAEAAPRSPVRAHLATNVKVARLVTEASASEALREPSTEAHPNVVAGVDLGPRSIDNPQP